MFNNEFDNNRADEKNEQRVNDINNENEKAEMDYDYVEYVYSVDLDDKDKKDEDYEIKPDARKIRRDRYATKMEIYDWIQCVVSALICGILIFVFIARMVGIDGYSMYPTLTHNDRVIISNLFYEPEVGDIVVVKTDYFGDTPIIKRIIAKEGQTVDIDFEAGIVYVDGEVFEESYIAEPTHDVEDFDGPVTIPEGHVFVMGDNRNESTDSRDDRVGLVNEKRILGKVYVLIIPGSDPLRGIERDWSRFATTF